MRAFLENPLFVLFTDGTRIHETIHAQAVEPAFKPDLQRHFFAPRNRGDTFSHRIVSGPTFRKASSRNRSSIRVFALDRADFERPDPTNVCA